MITISLDQLWGWLIPMAEILCLWFVYYRLLSVIQRTRAEQLLISLSFLLVFFFLTSLLRLERLNYLLTKLFTLSVIAVLVIFQPELRRALAKIVEGRRWWRGALQEEQVMEEVVNAVMELAKRRVGALIALEEGCVGHHVVAHELLLARMPARLLVHPPPGAGVDVELVEDAARLRDGIEGNNLVVVRVAVDNEAG